MSHTAHGMHGIAHGWTGIMSRLYRCDCEKISYDGARARPLSCPLDLKGLCSPSPSSRPGAPRLAPESLAFSSHKIADKGQACTWGYSDDDSTPCHMPLHNTIDDIEH
eukprot:scaffold19466_cov129-Isochrysis_galbana.AAC.3